MNVFFSVVVTVYNKEEFISETLQSVLKQSFTDFEVVVVNDGSSDGSLAVIEEFKDNRIRVLNQVNQGASA
ncbi:MAG: glycosyltransferase family A protein, partial [Flavobacteriaceae bacterium]|nr:glycosyltransferase family A protein [Flavobacteriaceae bacterium]